MDDPTRRPVSDWIADLEASEAELEAGLFVSGDEIMRELQASLARLEAKQEKPRTAQRR